MAQISKTFAVKYEAGHSYRETWEATELHCPACGKKDVWTEAGDGDYDVGSQYLCATCQASFFLPVGPTPNPKNWQDRQRLTAILGHEPPSPDNAPLK